MSGLGSSLGGRAGADRTLLVPGTEKTSRFLEGNLVYAVGTEDLERGVFGHP